MKYFVCATLLLLTVSFPTIGADSQPGGSDTPSLPVVDVQADLTRLDIAEYNLTGESQADASKTVQSAINYLAEREGGTLLFGPGTYRVGDLMVKPGVKIVGAGQDRTIFRAANRDDTFRMRGGELHDFTVYGTPNAADSGENWVPRGGKKNREGTGIARHIIRVGNSPNWATEDVLISNVTAKESRYDCLYVRGSQGLRVVNSTFNRAGRNIVSMVGNDKNFLFLNCDIGSLWGLYLFDIEPAGERAVSNGAFVNCTFDGANAGDMSTDTWGSMFTFSGNEGLRNSNVTLFGCEFRDISVRIRGVFPGAKFLYNRFEFKSKKGGPFVKIGNDPGTFRDAVVRGNVFRKDGQLQSADGILSGASFSGDTVIENNKPAFGNEVEIKEKTRGRGDNWSENHPGAE